MQTIWDKCNHLFLPVGSENKFYVWEFQEIEYVPQALLTGLPTLKFAETTAMGVDRDAASTDLSINLLD